MGVVLAPELEFVPMGAEDLDAVVAAEARAYAFPWTRGNFRDSLNAGHSAWICRREGRVAAYGVLMVVLDEAHLLNITVLPEYQGAGLGSEVLGRLMDIARSHGATRMLLEVRPSNGAGLALYRRFLFQLIGRRRGYYAAEGGREDALVLARDI